MREPHRCAGRLCRRCRTGTSVQTPVQTSGSRQDGQHGHGQDHIHVRAPLLQFEKDRREALRWMDGGERQTA